MSQHLYDKYTFMLIYIINNVNILFPIDRTTDCKRKIETLIDLFLLFGFNIHINNEAHKIRIPRSSCEAYNICSYDYFLFLIIYVFMIISHSLTFSQIYKKGI